MYVYPLRKRRRRLDIKFGVPKAHAAWRMTQRTHTLMFRSPIQYAGLLSLPLLVVGVSFHAGCALLLGINFLPLWLPTYAALVPASCTTTMMLLFSSYPYGGDDNISGDDVAGWRDLGWGAWLALATFAAGNCWYYYDVIVHRRVPEGRIWFVTG